MSLTKTSGDKMKSHLSLMVTMLVASLAWTTAAQSATFVYASNVDDGDISTFRLSEVVGLPANAELHPGVPRGAVGGMSATLAASRDLDHESWAADLHLTPDGKFLYASERTTSTLATFKVDDQRGRLTYLGSTSTEAQPCGFAIDDRGKFLIVAGEKTPTLSVYRIDSQSGALSRQGQYRSGKGANWVEIVRFQ